MKKYQAFTLIELLIVVAIIAILALIAVPNFLEAQTRAKVTRAKADMRAMTTALQAYRIDYDMYPPDVDSGAYNNVIPANHLNWRNEIASYYMLTTPTAYLTSIPRDPFYMNQGGSPRGMASKDIAYFEYSEDELHAPGTLRADEATWKRMKATQNGFTVISMGPDRYADFTWRAEDWEVVGYDSSRNPTLRNSRGIALGYDPTNGTVSQGDVLRTAKGFYGGGGQ